MTGRAMALLGSGEFEPWSEPVERWLLERSEGDGRVLILPTASAKEGDDVFDSWASKGTAHYAGMAVPAEVVPIKTREDAERRELAGLVDAASMVFFSGGNPWYLSEVLRDSAFCRAMFGRLGDGLAYAGCSAGVACLTDMTYDSDTQDFENVFKPGLGYARGVLFGPHWDMVDSWIPGATGFIVASVPEGQAFVGLDEDTAMVGDGTAWTVMGRQGVHMLRGGEWSHLTDGDTFELDLAIGA